MVPDERNDKKIELVNFFGAIGYISSCLGWIWALIQYINHIFPLLETNEQLIIIPVKTIPTETGIGPIIFGSAVAILMIVISIFLIIKIPGMISSAGKKIVQSTADKAAPFIIKSMHKRVTKKAKLKLSAKLKFVLKILIVLLPVIISALTIFSDKQELEYLIVITVSMIIAVFSILFFATQYISAKLFIIDAKDIR